MNRLSRIGICLLLPLQSLLQPVSAFELDGSKWPGAEALFYVDISGTSATGISWKSAFTGAMQDWSEETPFNFVLREEFLDPCLDDDLNGVDFTKDVCGTEYGERTLAVTIRRFASQVLGPPEIISADVVINDSSEFNIYDGSIIQFGMFGIDFRRVALHELGHVIGLNHEDILPAIMAPEIGNLDRLQPDDIQAVETLYGGLANCAVKNLVFGTFNGALNAEDCTVQELTVGSSDTSFVDLYRFDLTAPALLTLTMTSDTLDSVLVLANSDLEFIAFDNKSANNCDSSLSKSLGAGSYFLLANTFDVPPKAECGNQGEYQISASFISPQVPSLGAAQSLAGGEPKGSFKGGISNDNGATYGNSFSSTDSLDISATIEIDPTHQGQAGFILVAAVVEGQILAMNAQGQFVEVNQSSNSIPHAQTKILAAIEDFIIVSNLVAADLGIEDIMVDFVVGYGLLSNPNEIYYHQTPINLTITAP